MPTQRQAFTVQEHAFAERLAEASGFDPDFATWEESLFKGPHAREYEALVRRRAEGIGTTFGAARTSTAMSIHTHLAWAVSGFSVLRPTADLCAMLRLTEPDRELHPMPFVGFRLELPAGILPQCAGRDCVGAAIGTSVENGIPFFSVRLDLTGNRTINASSPWQEPVSDAESVRGADSREAEDVRRIVEDTKQLVRGLCSFISSKVEPLKAENEKAVARDLAAGRKPRPRIFAVGRTVKISRELRDIASRRDGPPLWKLKHRFIVRGHWRNQAVGPAHSERRKTWIAPHWKGPEGAEAWRHLYEVEATESK